MDEILVSINCISYNHEKYISDAIESFLMQKTTFQYEILIHDDASTDKTSEIIQKYQEKYPDIIKPILQKENQQSKGVKKISYRFNHTRARGKYIAICEGDDYWTDPYKLQKQVEYLETHPDCGLCFHAGEVLKVNKGKVRNVKPYNESCIVTTNDIILGDGGFMVTSSIMYRKVIMDNAPDFYFNAPVGDYPLQILASIKDYAYYINEFMSIYRIGVESSWSNMMISGSHKEIERKKIDLKQKLIVMLNEFNQFSNEKYIEAINEKVLRDEFEILLIKKDIKQLKMGKYNVLYKDLKWGKKFKLHLKYYFPDNYQYIKTFCKNKFH